MTTARNLATTTDLDLDAIAAKAARYLSGSICHDADGDPIGVVYYAHETHTYYAVSLDDCAALVDAVLHRVPDAYSLWCAGSTPDGEGETEEGAIASAQWMSPNATRD